MQLLPSGLVVPPLPYAVGLLVATVAVLAVLVRRRPAVTEHTVVAFAPWMVVGGAAHALEQAEVVPDALAPLATAPAVYLTTLVVTAAVWVVAIRRAAGDQDRATRSLAVVGVAALAALLVVAYAHAVPRVGPVALALPILLPLAGAVLTAPVAALVRRRWRTPAKQVGLAGLVALFGHALDGVSTAVGVDVIGTGERSPLPRAIMEFAGTLPTAPFLGRGWLFVVVKLVVAVAVVLLLAGYVEEEPAEGNLLLTVVAAVGMGPAANNVFLFLLTGI